MKKVLYLVKATTVMAVMMCVVTCGNRGQNSSPEENFAKEMKAAEKGDAAAMSDVGRMYFTGEGVTKDVAKAAEWLNKAAEKGDAEGMVYLGYMYHTGEGVTKDVAKAAEWYTKAAEKGDAKGMVYLGYMYHTGEGVTKDVAKAMEWYTKAAEEGEAEGMVYLGYMYLQGEGVTKDVAKAMEWLTKAAEGGSVAGMYETGRMYYDGEGVTKDAAKAVEWYTKAAEGGNVAGMYETGRMYYDGDGVAKDNDKAMEWLFKAAEERHAMALKYLKTIPSSLQRIKSRFEWELAEDGTLTISGKGAMPNYEDPHVSGGFLPPWYEDRSKIKKVVIAPGITSIGNCAFEYYYNSLTSVNISNSVTEIGRFAFAYNEAITSVTIPNSVTEIGHCAFIDCSGLKSVTMPESVTVIGNNAFDKQTVLIGGGPEVANYLKTQEEKRAEEMAYYEEEEGEWNERLHHGERQMREAREAEMEREAIDKAIHEGRAIEGRFCLSVMESVVLNKDGTVHSDMFVPEKGSWDRVSGTYVMDNNVLHLSINGVVVRALYNPNYTTDVLEVQGLKGALNIEGNIYEKCY